MENNGMLKKMVRHSLDMLCAVGSDGCFIQVSDASRHILGYEPHELEGISFVDFVHPDDLLSTKQVAQEIVKGSRQITFENRYIRKDGKPVPLSWFAKWSEQDKVFFCNARDMTESYRIQQKITEKEAMYQAMIEHGSDMMALLDEDGNYLFVSGAITKLLGYTPEQLVGRNAFSLVHPDDLHLVQEAWTQFVSKHLICPSDFRFRALNGEWRWINSVISDQLQNPAIRAYVVSSRDVTERKKASKKLEVSEERYKALFENNPDIVTFENTEGIVTNINKAFREALGTSSDYVLGKPAAAFLPPEMAKVNHLSLQEALLGSTLRYDLELITKDKKPKIFDTVKFPVIVDGEVIGAQTISKDITPIIRSFETIERQARKLNTIFESITDAFFMLDKDWNYTYVNSEFERITGAREQDYVGKHILEVSEYGTDGIFYQQYIKAATTGSSVHFEAYSKKLGKWLEVKAFPSDEGLSVYFTDVTDKVKAKQESEKLSLVASNTDNGVMITDATGRTEWVNDGFVKMTGYTLAEIIGRKPGSVLQGPETDPDMVNQMSRKLKQGIHFNTILANYKKSGEMFWVSIDIAPIFDETGSITQYIAIQKDITFRKDTEAKLLEMTQDLYKQNKDLEEFTYIVSHNLRAPVANALGLANILTKADKSDSAFDTSLAYLKTSLLKMDAVLRDVNMILSVKSKQDVLEMEPVNVLDVFWQAYVHLQEPTLLCGGEVKIELPADQQILANRPYLFSIFYNLMSNAIKYRSPERQLQIRIGSTESADGKLIIYLADNGTGFDSTKAGDDVFKLYKRFHADKKGRGMGLFLVKTHVEAMGWQIKVNSKPDKGTKFLIYVNR